MLRGGFFCWGGGYGFEVVWGCVLGGSGWGRFLPTASCGLLGYSSLVSWNLTAEVDMGLWWQVWLWLRYDVESFWILVCGKCLMYLSEEGWESWSIEMPTGVVLWWGLISAMQEEDGWTFWKFIFSWEVGRGFVWDWIVCGNKTTVIGELQMEWQGCSYGIWLCRGYGLRTERLSGIMMLLASFKVCRLVALLVNYFNCPKWIEMS